MSEEYNVFNYANNKGLIIHWLPNENNLVVEVLLEDATKALGLGEKSMLNLKVGDIVQLERSFFARVDNIEKNKIYFWYLHK